MEEDKVLLSKMPKNHDNPFLAQAVEEVQQNVVRKFVNSSGPDRKAVLNMVDGETGEVLRTQFVRQMQVDEDKFTKIFINQFGAFFNLTKAGLKVFGYIMTAMKPAQDLVVFQIEKAMEYTGYKTTKAIYKGLAELCNASIIARAWTDGLYFINPMICFNGSRVTFVNEYIKKETEKQKALQDAKFEEDAKQFQEEAKRLERE